MLLATTRDGYSGGTGPSVGGTGANVYAVYGDMVSGTALTMPAAYQHEDGSTIGGVPSTLFFLDAKLRHDSWLTVGLTDGDTNQLLSKIEHDDSEHGFAAWGAHDSVVGLSVSNGAVFFSRPADGCVPGTRACTLAQLTVASDQWSATLNLHGRTSSANSAERWEQTGISFSATVPPPQSAMSSNLTVFDKLREEPSCSCDEGFICTQGCEPPYLNHTCESCGDYTCSLKHSICTAETLQVSYAAVQPVLRIMARHSPYASLATHTELTPYVYTARLQVMLRTGGFGASISGGANVYAMYGGTAGALTMPAAYQVALGATIGGVVPAFYVADPLLEFDSWLTVGLTEGDPSAKLSEIEREEDAHAFDAWGAVGNKVCPPSAPYNVVATQPQPQQ